MRDCSDTTFVFELLNTNFGIEDLRRADWAELARIRG